MRKFLYLFLILPNLTYAIPADVWCWSENKLIFHKHVQKVFESKKNLIAVTNNATYYIYNSDCLIEFNNKK
jgi:hypothetical protein